MTRIATGGIHLNVEVAGTGEPLLLLHGFTGSAAGWAPRVTTLGQRFTTIAVDLPGHGASDSPVDPARYHLEACAADLIRVLGHLGLPSAHVLGYSMGGRMALHLAAAYPERVRALVLESASPGLADPQARQARVESDEALAGLIERQGVEAFVDRWERLALFASQARLPEPVRAGLRAQRLRNHPRGLANSLRGMGTGVQSPLWDHLPGLTLPVLILAGELDLKFVEIARAMCAALPAAQLVLVPEAGHTPHLEQPELFDRAVLDFLSSV